MGYLLLEVKENFFHWNGKRELGCSKLRLRKLMEKYQFMQVLQQLPHQKRSY